MYKTYNTVLKKVNRGAKDKYYGYRLKGADNDTRKVWSILNEVVDRKQCKHRIPNRFIINGCSIRNRKNITNAFNNYFASIGQDIMKRQQPKMSCGIDTISNKVVKTCYKELAKPMTLVINKSISECYVPQVYKIDKIILPYKKVPLMGVGIIDQLAYYLLSLKSWKRRYVTS